jgi:hypothetical protein
VDGRTGELGGYPFGARLGAVGDEDGRGAVLDKMAGGELGHFACAYEEYGFFLEGAENLSGEVDGYGGDGDGARADLSFIADFFGDGEGALEEGFEIGRDGAYFAGDGVGLFDLAEDLGLAYDHAVERAGDAKEMADGFALAKFVEMGLDVAGGDGEVFVEEADEAGLDLRLGLGLDAGGFAGLVLNGEEFNAVAGREDEAFADAGLVEESAGGVGEAGGGDGEALADLDGRGVVVDAEQDETDMVGWPGLASGLELGLEFGRGL